MVTSLRRIFCAPHSCSSRQETSSYAANCGRMPVTPFTAGPTQLKKHHGAASNYAEAANCFRKVNPQFVVDCLQKTVDIYTDMGRLNMAARYAVICGRLCESQRAWEDAMRFYKVAAHFFYKNDNFGVFLALNNFAECAVRCNRLFEAEAIFDTLAKQDEIKAEFMPFIHSCIFRLLILLIHRRSLDTSDVLKRYETFRPSFSDTRERQLVKDLIAALENEDADQFTDAVKSYDRISRLDEWHTNHLDNVKPAIGEARDTANEVQPTPAKRRSTSDALGTSNFGVPKSITVKLYESFTLSYDSRTRNPFWVFEHLTPESLVHGPSVDRSKCKFRPDESMHPYFRSQNEDYRRSGYDRGHMVPAANHRRTQDSADQTFLLSNMSSQVGQGFNRGKWKMLEQRMRDHAKTNKNVYVFTGPLYLPHQESDGNRYVKYKVIGKNDVAVPTHFFKVALIEKAPHQYELESFLLPNAVIPNGTPLKNVVHGAARFDGKRGRIQAV